MYKPWTRCLMKTMCYQWISRFHLRGSMDVVKQQCAIGSGSLCMINILNAKLLIGCYPSPILVSNPYHHLDNPYRYQNTYITLHTSHYILKAVRVASLN